MGSPKTERDRTSSEGPQHQVSIKPFYMGKYPVTQAQWRFVANLEPISSELEPNPSNFPGNNRPVEQVSWHDAVEFCARLSRYTKRKYALPSEAQWEYACRAGTTTPFHFGETITTDLANYRGTDWKEMGWDGSYVGRMEGEYREETTPVDYFDVANSWGLCDMHGNVWEWCIDHWRDSYQNTHTDERAWLTEDENNARVLRGGSWNYNPRHCRAANRRDNWPDIRDIVIGFRVCCSNVETSSPPITPADK